MRELGRLFRTFCANNHSSRAQHVNKIEALLNITTHHSTNITPQELHFGKPINDEISKIISYPEKQIVNHQLLITLAKDNIKKSFATRTKNQKISPIVLKLGDLVLLRVRHLSNAFDKTIHKFFHLFEGPYLITQIIGNNAFVLSDPSNPDKVKGTYNRTNLRKYYEP